MEVTLTDTTILVNLPNFGGKDAGQCFSQRNRGLNSLDYAKLKIRLGIKKLNTKIFSLAFFLMNRHVSSTPSS